MVRTRCVKHDCKSLPQSSRQMARQISVSLITPKSRWYKSGYIVPTYTDSSPHTSSSPSTASQPSLYNHSTPLTANNFCSSLSFLSELIPSNRRQRQQGVTREYKMDIELKKRTRRVTAVTLPLRDHQSSTTLTSNRRVRTIQAHYVDTRSSFLPQLP